MRLTEVYKELPDEFYYRKALYTMIHYSLNDFTERNGRKRSQTIAWSNSRDDEIHMERS